MAEHSQRQITLKIPEHIHNKFKMISMVRGITMTEQLKQWIEREAIMDYALYKLLKKPPVPMEPGVGVPSGYWLCLRNKDDFSVIPEEGKEKVKNALFVRMDQVDRAKNMEMYDALEKNGYYLYKVSVSFTETIIK